MKIYDTNHKVTNNNGGQEEGYTGHVAHKHTVPHTLNPFSTKYSEDNHETVHKVREVPSRQVAVREAVYIVCIRNKGY